MIIVTLWIGEVFLHVSNSELFFIPLLFYKHLFDLSVIKFMAMVIIVIGFSFLIMAYKTIGESWRIGIDLENLGKLIIGGIYSISRNPIFFIFYFWGIFFVNPNLIFLIYGTAATINIHYQIIFEEQELFEIYGDKYKEYLLRVNRYFTF